MRYERIGREGLPFSEERPLLFHVLTTLPPGPLGQEQMLDLMEGGGTLMPRRMIEADPEGAWGGEDWESSLLFKRDRLAGDHRYAFFSPCNVYSKFDQQGYRDSRPALAFDAWRIFDEHGFAFRVRDLNADYVLVMEDHRIADEDEDEEGCEFDEIYAVGDAKVDLEEVAQAGTQFDDDAAADLLGLYAELCGAFRNWMPAQEVPQDDPHRLAIYAASRDLVPTDERHLEELARWAEEGSDAYLAVKRLIKAWQLRFGAPGADLYGFPSEIEAATKPEVLVPGPVRLAQAAFYRDGYGRWQPLAGAAVGRGMASNPLAIPA